MTPGSFDDVAARLTDLGRQAGRRTRVAALRTGSPAARRSQVEGFLAAEARLLDERRWRDWLGLWAEDASYSMPTRRTVLPPTGDRAIATELTPDGGAWWFDETREVIELRVAKLETGKAWAEEPPSRTRRFVTNIEVADAGEGVDTVRARSNLLVHRGRRDSEVEWFSCGRTDLLRIGSAGLRLVSRRVVIDANVVPADNLVLFF